MEIVLTVMSFMGGMVIGGFVTIVTMIFVVNYVCYVTNNFNIFHARVLPKAKPTKVRKAEIYRAVAKSLKEQKLTWTLKFNVGVNRTLSTPVATIGEDFFYIRTNEIKVVCQDLVSDLRKRGYEVDVIRNVKGNGMDIGDKVDDVENITLNVKVK